MEAERTVSKALVLAGGGVSGVAWELGILTALERAGFNLAQQADLVVGTSAGSVVGSQITSGSSLEEIYASQLAPVAQSSERAVDFDLNRFQQMIMTLYQEHNDDAQAIRIGIGKQAIAATQNSLTSEAERRAIIAARLPSHDWPTATSHTKLKITAVDAVSGEFIVFDREAGVGLVDAVAASCAVPLVWPTVSIKGRSYMDGGMRSSTNADLAVGYDRILILVPLAQPDNLPPILGSNLGLEQTLLEQQGSQVMVIKADEAAIRAMGLNVLDPANRANSARAGLTQSGLLAQSVSSFWSLH